MYNPSGRTDVGFISGEPIGSWYYPNYHRFHNLNLIANFKPLTFLTISLKGSLATGAPKNEIGVPEVFAAQLPDGTYIERWSRSSTYSDELRNDLSCPVDIKIVISYFFPGTRIKFENYFGVENVFASLYTPKTNKAIDGFTGKELSGSGEAEFTIGTPIPSFGIRLSY